MEKLYMKVNDYIRGKIAREELRAGDKLPTERELAEALGISRNSVREGLRVLENVGVVSSHQGSGNYVATNFEDSLIDVMAYMFMLKKMNDAQMTEFRYAIELQAMNIIAGKLTEQEKAALLFHLDLLETSQDEQERVIHDKAIHLILVEATRNDYMKANYHALERLLDAYIPRLRGKIMTGMHGDEDLRYSHRMMVEGAVNGDVERGAEGLRLHFQYIKTYQNDPDPEGVA